MKNKLFKIVSVYLAIMLLITQLNVTAKGIDPYDLYSISAVLIDGNDGRILLEKNPFEVRAMASTTKIMTLILALENGKLDDIVEISEYAAAMPKVKLGLTQGKKYYLKDLLYSMMLESHNDSAVAVAECISGDVSAFAKLMNDKARELNLDNTYFITPNGLDSENEINKHSTTAYELALIMKYCITDSPMKDEFIEICQTREYRFSDVDKTSEHIVYNRNAFLDKMDGVIAGKTGFTSEAGYCYVCALENQGKTYVLALLGCGWPYNKSYKWTDSKYLFEYAIENFRNENILNPDTFSKKIKVANAINTDYIKTYIRDSIDISLCDEDDIKYNINVPAKIEAPVYKNQPVGSVDIYINNELYRSVIVYSTQSVKKNNYIYHLKHIFKKYMFAKSNNQSI